ncbi:unnamed protein product [Rhodiola kirilowii]
MLQILIPKDKREIKPILLKVTAALAFSFAGYLLSLAHARWRTRPSLPPPPLRSLPSSENGSQFDAKGSKDPQHPKKDTRLEESVAPKVPIEDDFSPSSRNTTDGNEFLKSVENESSTDVEPDTPKLYRTYEREDYEEEVKRLRNMVRMLRDRERNLELQLLEYYGLKEQETTMMELQNRLKINNMEARLFTIKIETLQAENRRLEARVAEFTKVAGELETARAKIKILRKKLRYEAEQNKEHILALQKRVEILQQEEQKATLLDPNAEVKLERLSELEKEADDLRKSNAKLKIENSDLVKRLESTQILATSVLEDQEGGELRQVSLKLKQKNEELAKEIEQLQADRCADVEELVYLRWINACLRHELRNFQAQPGQTVARDLSKTLSPKSEAKAKQLILEYASTEGMVGDKGIDFDSEWSSSHASLMADCEPEHEHEHENEDDDSNSANRHHHSHKAKFFSKLRRLITGKDRHHHHHHHHHHDNKSTQIETMQVGSDLDSPNYASSSSTRTDFKASDTSLRFSRTLSLDIQSRSSLNIEDVKEISRMSSDAGSSHSYRRYSGFRESLSDLSEQDAEKSELVKYAEALKGSRASTPR